VIAPIVDEAASFEVMVILPSVLIDACKVVRRESGVQLVQGLHGAAGAVTEGDARGSATAGRCDVECQTAKREVAEQQPHQQYRWQRSRRSSLSPHQPWSPRRSRR
jgi:uncharacterized 2Fe-2S/4Fe-4S cluster protein (DUF4445 family)